jgi:TPR repeat protein
VEHVAACRAACAPEVWFEVGEEHARAGRHETAIECYDRAIAKCLPRACAAKAWILFNSRCNPDKLNARNAAGHRAFETAFDIARRGMAWGCSCSKAVVAMCYLTGCGVVLNINLGSQLAKESAYTGSKYGLYALAWDVQYGDSMISNYRSDFLYARSADQGFPDAMFDLAMLKGASSPLLKKAAAVGHPAARYMLFEASAFRHNADADDLYRFALSCSALEGRQHPLATMSRYRRYWERFKKSNGHRHEPMYTCVPGHTMAAQYLAAAAGKGHADAQFALAAMHEDGRGVQQDDAEAAQYYRRAAVQGHAHAMHKLAAMCCDGRCNVDEEEAFRWIKLAADQEVVPKLQKEFFAEHVAAKCKLADMLRDGKGVGRDDEAAAKLYRLAAELGHPDALCKLVMMCSQGRYVVPDADEAASLIALAMRSDNKDACYHLAVMHEEGSRFPLNLSLAVTLYKRAAFGSCNHSIHAIEALNRAANPAHNGQGDVVAQIALAGIYSYGLGGVPSDLFQAARHYRMAALQGNATAQFKYAEMHACGAGCAQDFENAAHFFRLAADQGHVASQFALGVRYETGHGVQRDEVKASSLFLLAASQGDVDAQFHLASMYEDGRGVQQDDAEAAQYYRQAAVQGHAHAMHKLAGMHRRGRGVVLDEAMAQALYRRAEDHGHSEAECQLVDFQSFPVSMTSEQSTSGSEKRYVHVQNWKRDGTAKAEDMVSSPSSDPLVFWGVPISSAISKLFLS